MVFTYSRHGNSVPPPFEHTTTARLTSSGQAVKAAISPDARYIAYTGSSFLSNIWRPDSQANAGDASLRVLSTFGSKMVGNAIREFWPDVKQHVFRRQKTP